jgi:murein DD-endopeptidase MepM/ murein hydrolase activator NlpD
LARHRSPSGARPVPDEYDAAPHASAPSGTHRLPAPPSPSLHVRAMAFAVAGGALVAAGQTLVSAHGDLGVSDDPYAKLAQNAMLPVTDPVQSAAASAAPATSANAIGGDQLGNSFTLPALDERSEVDVASLVKAAGIGEEMQKRTSMIRAALAGGAPEAVLDGSTAYVLPTDGRFTSGFGARWGVTHYGIDLAAPIGTPIFALTDGVVEESGPASGFGMWVVLKHPDGTHSVYGHINRSFVGVGQKVRAGEEIAEVGNRGQSTGPHLHLEIWDAAKNKINPLPWLRARGIDVTSTGTGDGPAD